MRLAASKTTLDAAIGTIVHRRQRRRKARRGARFMADYH
jgi:hypothetical protein